MIKIVHFSDLHFGSGERHGTINPETGLNRRFEDFVTAFNKTIKFALDNKVDLVIFTGDTYKHATPEPIYQREFAKGIRKLSANKIPTILLVGNHDILYRIDGSDALDIYDTLAIDHVIVFNKIELKNIKTKNGTIQVIALPHITKSRLLAKEEYRSLAPKDQDNLMIQKIKEAISSCIEKLDQTNPAILLGHGTLEMAQFGSEQDLSIGKVLSYPLSFFQNTNLDYVGFGHIHRHQILQKSNPVILYAGSLERVDFGEEGEDKGFVYLEIEKGNVSYEFKSISPRNFITISCDLTSSNNLQSDLESEVIKKKKPDAIIRVRYKINEDDIDKIQSDKIRNLIEDSFSYSIQSEIVRKERTYKIDELDSTLITQPMIALEKYLFDQTDEDKKKLLEKAKGIIEQL